MSAYDEKAIRLLLDKSELTDLVMKYARYIDRRDMVGLRSLYHDDAIEERGEFFTGPVDEFIKLTSPSGAAKHFQVTVHRISNMLFEIEGEKAQGEIYIESYRRTVPPNPMDIVQCGRYLDHYERRGGIWKFTYRTMTIDRSQITPVDDAWYTDAAKMAPMGLPNGDDPSYDVLTLFKRWDK